MRRDVFIDFSQLGKTFATPDGPLCVVKDFNLRVPEGQFVCLIGHSGCGKSTVLSILAGLQQPTEGVIIMAGKEVVGPGPDRGMVFQSPCLLPWLSALGNVLLGVTQAYPGKRKSERTAIARHFLEMVGLGNDMNKMPAELSQGMRQRVGIARAFALNPKTLLLDEPFGMLDGITRLELQEELLRIWEQDKKTVVMVTHDVDEAVFLADCVVMMTNGPYARVGRVLSIDLPRPRKREALLDDARFYSLRGELLAFLEDAEQHKPVINLPSAATPEELPAVQCG